MCLGAKARAANEQLKRDYKHKLELRERKWMQDLSVTNVQRMQYAQGIDASNLSLGNFYTDIQEKYGEAVDAMFTQSQQDWKEFLAKNSGDTRKASGQLGRSTDRISAVDLGAYLKKGHDQVQQLTKAAKEWGKAGGQMAAKTRAQQMQMFADNMFVKHPDIAPPQPVGHNVGHAAMMDLLSIVGTAASVGTAFATSSKKLKDNIVKIGKSIDGHNIYKFNYKDSPRKYVGVIAEEVLKTKPEAVVTMPNGYLGVNYSLIDVQFKEVT